MKWEETSDFNVPQIQFSRTQACQKVIKKSRNENSYVSELLMLVLYQINLNVLTIIKSLFNCFSELMTR